MSSACRGSNGAIPPAGDGVVAMGGAPGAPPMPPSRPPAAPSRPQAPMPRATHPGACGTRSTLLSVVFQAFARNSVRPLHLGALSRKWPLDVGVRHAQTPTIKCDV